MTMNMFNYYEFYEYNNQWKEIPTRNWLINLYDLIVLENSKQL